jgi:hypothetical protein
MVQTHHQRYLYIANPYRPGLPGTFVRRDGKIGGSGVGDEGGVNVPDLKVVNFWGSLHIQQQEIKTSTFLSGLYNNCEVIASKINAGSLQIKLTEYEDVTKGYMLPQAFPFSVGFYQWICRMPDRLTLIEISFLPLEAYLCLLMRQHGKTGRKYPAAISK